MFAPVPGLCRVAILPRMHIVIGGSNPTQALEKLCRYFNNISVGILVLNGAPFPPMVKVASDQSHLAPSGRGAAPSALSADALRRTRTREFEGLAPTAKLETEPGTGKSYSARQRAKAATQM